MGSNLSAGVPWVLAAVLGTALFVAVQRGDQWRAIAEQRGSELDLSMERILADSLFLAGDIEAANALYATIAERTGDTTLMGTRPKDRPEQETIDDAPQPLRVTRVERDEHDARRMAQLEDELDQVRAELDALRARSVNGVTKEMLRFPSLKKNGGTVVYVGETSEGRAHGYGHGVWPSGGHYEGEWKHNMRHGYGRFVWADGEHYEGGYVDDLREGQGIYYWKNGQYWRGEWHEDKRHGPGVLYEADGRVRVSGFWENDKLVRQDKKTGR